MKTKLAVLALTAVAALCVAQTGIKSKSNYLGEVQFYGETKKQKHEVVVLQVSPHIGAGAYDGFIIFNASVSSGVEPIPVWDWSNDVQATNLVGYAQKVADLLDQGFEIKSILPPGQYDYGQTMVLTK